MMCGCTSQSAIADWGRNYSRHWLYRLGFKRPCAPSQSTIHRIFNGIDSLKLELLLSHWCQQVALIQKSENRGTFDSSGISESKV